MAQSKLTLETTVNITGVTGLEDAIDERLTDALNDAIRRGRINLKRKINEILVRYMRNNETFLSIADPSGLQREFGLTTDQAKAAQEDIIKILRLSTDIVLKDFVVKNGQIRGGDFYIDILEADLKKFINMKSGEYTSKGGYSIDWMQWLLTRGVEIIWPTYGIKYYSRIVKASRSNYALMFKADYKGYRVPEKHKGTIDDNFIIDVVDSATDEIVALAEREIESEFR